MDLDVLPEELRRSARVTDGGEVVWQPADAVAAVAAIADAGLVVLGLDVRDYEKDGSFIEVAWSVFEPAGSPEDVEAGRQVALDALARADIPGSWILITVAEAC